VAAPEVRVRVRVRVGVRRGTVAAPEESRRLQVGRRHLP